MIVKDLIAELQKCPQDAIVMYDMQNSYRNGDMPTFLEEWQFGIDDVLIGGGTTKGFVFLTDELYDDALPLEPPMVNITMMQKGDNCVQIGYAESITID